MAARKTGAGTWIDLCLSALATAWVITFVATTGLVAALAVEAVWDKTAYMQTLQHVVITDPPY
jgi:hypothetical protein